MAASDPHDFLTVVFAGADGGLGNSGIATGGCFAGGPLLLDLDFALALVSAAARVVSIFVASGAGFIFGGGFWSFGADVALFLRTTAALAASGLVFNTELSLFLTSCILGGGAMPAGGGAGPTGCVVGSIIMSSR